ncbi:MAG TPA: siphovirus ReqiPepy6 Gp37-like family protein [Pseudonocardia sp.]
MAVDLLVTDLNLAYMGAPLDGWTDLSAEVRFNEPAAGTVTLPAHPQYLQLLQPGRRMVVIRDGDIWCAGPIEEPQRSKRSASDDPKVGTVQVSFTDDLGRMGGLITYPDPSVNAESQDTATDEVYTQTAGAGTIIRTLANLNCGPGAVAGRRIQKLTAPTTTLGASTTITTRFEPLLDAFRTLAAADGLGFRTRQDGADIVFEVYEPVDRTLSARFSYDFGNLREDEYALIAPTATSEIVMGGDEGSREYVEVTNGGAVADWWRQEKFIEQSGTTDSAGELTQAGAAALLEDNPQAYLATETVDTPTMRAGVHFGLGDLVSVVPYPGAQVTDLVRAMRLESTPDGGDRVVVTVGTAEATANLRIYRQIQELARRLGRIETRR